MKKERFTKWLVSGAITLPKLVIMLVGLGSAATVPVNHLLQLSSGTLAVSFALFQAVVCLFLLILVPQPVPPHHQLMLKITDVIAPRELIRRLCPAEGPYKLLLTQLRNSRRRVETCSEREPIDFTFVSAIVDDLNVVIESGELIYDSAIFGTAQLSRETLRMCRNNPTRSQCIQANRMILEDLFPEGIAQYPRNQESVNKACRNVRLWIQLMFLCWVIYYGVTAVSAYNQDRKSGNSQATANTSTTIQSPPIKDAQLSQTNLDQKGPILDFTLNLLSALTAVFIFFLYVEMSELTVEDVGRSINDRNPEAQVRDAFNQKAVFAFAALIVVCANVAVFVVPPQYHDVIVGTVDIIIGCGSGVVMALVVGRLGSKFIDPGTGVVALLYLYAVIQPLSIYFGEKPNARFYATTLALFLKAFLWLVFYWTFTDGKLWSYVVALRNLLLGEARPELLGAR